jgi:dCMP deaminase
MFWIPPEFAYAIGINHKEGISMEKRDRWDAHFIQMCRLVSNMSKDSSTQVGAVIVGADREILSTGFNGIPRYCDDKKPSRHERPDKYFWFEHAERNAIFNAAKNGIRLEGATMYCSAPSCADCSRAIIQSGIRRVIFPKRHPFLEREDWAASFRISVEMLDEAQVKMRWYESFGEDLDQA